MRFIIIIFLFFLVSCKSNNVENIKEYESLQDLKKRLEKTTILLISRSSHVFKVNAKNLSGKKTIDIVISCLDFSGKDGYEPWEESYSFVLEFFDSNNKLIEKIYLYSFAWCVKGKNNSRLYYKYIPNLKGKLLIDYLYLKYFKEIEDKEWECEEID